MAGALRLAMMEAALYETDVYEYFAFGYNYFILRSQSQGKNVKGDGGLTWFMDEVIDRLDDLNL